MADDSLKLEPGKVAQFARNIEHVGQQKQNRLVPYVNADLAFTEKGDRFTDNTFGISDPVELLSDWAPSPEGQVSQFERVAFGKMYADGKYVTDREQAEKLVNPTSAVVQAMAYGRERRRDQTIAAGIFAATQLEKTQDGDVQSVSFPSANIVAVDDTTYHRGKADGASAPTSGHRALTPAKLRKARKLLEDGRNDSMGSRPVVLYEDEDLQGLLTSDELTNADYTTLRRLEDGEINSFMGVTFVKVDPGTLPLVPGQTTRHYTALYYPHYMIYKDRPLKETRIVERADRNFNWYAFYKAQDFVLRKQDTAFVWIDIERY